MTEINRHKQMTMKPNKGISEPSRADGYAVFRRLSNFVLVVIIGIVAVNLWFMHEKNANNWYDLEAEQLGRSLASQAARVLARPLQNNDLDSIELYVSNIDSDDLVKGSTLYDEQGKVIKSVDLNFSLVLEQRHSGYTPLIFIEDVVFDGEIIGYIKIMLDRDRVIQHHRSFNRSQLTQTLLVMLLTAIAAIIATRLFYKIRINYFNR